MMPALNNSSQPLLFIHPTTDHHSSVSLSHSSLTVAIMTKFIYSDSDLPASLNTSAKQIAKAKELARSHLNMRATKARGVDIQGFFSRTLIVTMESGEKVIVQLRVEPLDLDTFRRARQALGDVVPDIAEIRDEALEREEIWPYYMTFIPGRTWRRSAAFCNPALNVACAKSLGRISPVASSPTTARPSSTEPLCQS